MRPRVGSLAPALPLSESPVQATRTRPMTRKRPRCDRLYIGAAAGVGKRFSGHVQLTGSRAGCTGSSFARARTLADNSTFPMTYAASGVTGVDFRALISCRRDRWSRPARSAFPRRDPPRRRPHGSLLFRSLSPVKDAPSARRRRRSSILDRGKASEVFVSMRKDGALCRKPARLAGRRVVLPNRRSRQNTPGDRVDNSPGNLPRLPEFLLPRGRRRDRRIAKALARARVRSPYGPRRRFDNRREAAPYPA